MGLFRNLWENIPVATAHSVINEFTFWRRLEPRARADNFVRSLQAQIRDPLWMLARQRQFGEFRGDDAGSPTKASIKTVTSKLGWLKFPGANSPKRITAEVPLEVNVEQEKPPSDKRTAVRIGQQFKRELRRAIGDPSPDNDALFDEIEDKFKAKYAIGEVSDADDATREFLKVVAGRELDGEMMMEEDLLAENPVLPDDLGISEGREEDAARTALINLYEWHRLVYGTPPDGNAAWQPDSLEYKFRVSAPHPDGNDREIVLAAPEYDGKTLDWPDFSLSPDPNEQLTGTSAGPANDSPREESFDFIPRPVSFRGMPHHRYWEFEERQIDFGNLTVEVTDLAKLLVMEFALIHGGDWFVLPLPLPLGSLTFIPELEVTDVFGQKTLILRADAQQGEGQPRWGMFRLSADSANAVPVTDDFLLLPPALPRTEQTAVLEEVLFIRDEMANMVWAVERTVLNGIGESWSGYEAYRERLRRAESEAVPTGAGTGAPGPENEAPVPYRLANVIPENWIPYIAVHTENSMRATQLRRAIMVRNADLLEPGENKPKTRILISAGDEHLVNEETVSRAARRIRLTVQRSRWQGGSTFVSVGRDVGPGGGEGSSGLRFDFLEE